MSNKISRSLVKLILPFVYKILIKFKLNRRVINFLSDKSYRSNDQHNFTSLISGLLKNEKIISLDVGAQGGFNSDKFFPKKYNKYFKKILVDPLEDKTKIKEDDITITKGLWSSPCEKILYILDKRPESSSLYKPDINSLKIYNYKDKEINLFDISKEEKIECDTLNASLEKLNIDNLHYLKIDTQGAELEILKGLESFRPLIIKCEVQIFPMYKKEPCWTEVTNLLYKLGYIVSDWKKIGSHSTRAPVEMDMIFIPNFLIESGKKLIVKNKKKFICLMLITGQIKLLKKISKILDFGHSEFYMKTEDKYFN